MNKRNHAQGDNLKLAVFSIVLAVLILSFGDAVIKSLSVSFPLSQIYVVRSVFALIVLFILVKFREPTLELLPRSFIWTSVRSFLLALMWIAYYAALPHMKLSVAAAVYYTAPLFITLFSALFTGDRVGLRSWFAMVLGFVGVIIIVRPDANGFNSYVILPLIAATLYALAMVLTRTKCLDESPKILTLSLNVMFVLTGIIATVAITIWQPSEPTIESNPFLFGGWAQLDDKGWFAMAILAAVSVIGSVFSAIAYQKGSPSIVASFDYSYLVFSAMWGLVLFAEAPDALTIVGMLMIAGAGLIGVRE